MKNKQQKKAKVVPAVADDNTPWTEEAPEVEQAASDDIKQELAKPRGKMASGKKVQSRIIKMMNVLAGKLGHKHELQGVRVVEISRKGDAKVEVRMFIPEFTKEYLPRIKAMKGYIEKKLRANSVKFGAKSHHLTFLMPLYSVDGARQAVHMPEMASTNFCSPEEYSALPKILYSEAARKGGEGNEARTGKSVKPADDDVTDTEREETMAFPAKGTAKNFLDQFGFEFDKSNKDGSIRFTHSHDDNAVITLSAKRAQEGDDEPRIFYTCTFRMEVVPGSSAYAISLSTTDADLKTALTAMLSQAKAEFIAKWDKGLQKSVGGRFYWMRKKTIQAADRTEK